jgi:hypothetical protein
VFGWLFRKSPTVPERFAIKDAHYFLDGGTTVMLGTDERGRRRSIQLTQHMFEQRGGVGWLYLDRNRVPRRSDTERAILRVLRASLEELRQRPRERRPGEQTMAEALAGRGAVLFGSGDLAEMAQMSAAERLVRLVSDVLAYVESDQYGQVTG